MTKCMIKSIFDFKRDKINITDLCKSCGISRTVFYNYLDNKQEPTVSVAISITHYLNDKLSEQGYTNGLYSVETLWVNE